MAITHKRITATVVALIALVATLLIAPRAEAVPTALAVCHNSWGSFAKTAGTAMVQNRIRGVRADDHADFDRLVIDLGPNKTPGVTARYVTTLFADPSGFPVTLAGNARLRIVVRAPVINAFPVNNHSLVNVAGFQSFRQVANVGAFEGITTFGLGTRAKLPFTVFRTTFGDHKVVVVKVANRWC